MRRIIRGRPPLPLSAVRILGADDQEEQEQTTGDAANEDGRRAPDLRYLTTTFPHCDTHHLIEALIQRPEEASTCLDDVFALKILSGLERAIEQFDLDAASDAITLTAVLFRLDWTDRTTFVNRASHSLLQILAHPDTDSRDLWHNALDAICYTLITSDIEDPSIIRCAVGSQLMYLQDFDASFDDKARAVEFLMSMAHIP
jgi:hypothetical protein